MPRRDRKYIGPHTLRSCVVYVTEAEARRVRRVVVTCGSKRAASETLGVGLHTVEAAIEQGRIQRATHERLFDAVARFEAGRVVA